MRQRSLIGTILGYNFSGGKRTCWVLRYAFTQSKLKIRFSQGVPPFVEGISSHWLEGRLTLLSWQAMHAFVAWCSALREHQEILCCRDNSGVQDLSSGDDAEPVVVLSSGLEKADFHMITFTEDIIMAVCSAPAVYADNVTEYRLEELPFQQLSQCLYLLSFVTLISDISIIRLGPMEIIAFSAITQRCVLLNLFNMVPET